MTEEIQLKKIDELIQNLDSETLSALENIRELKRYKKGEFLLHQDKLCRYSFWIEQGILRKFYWNDTKEITTELIFEHDIAVSFDSYVLQKPSKEFIQAVTDVTVYQTEAQSFQMLKAKFPKLVELDLMMTEYYAMWLEKRLFEFRTSNATERYLQLLRQQPHIILEVPLTYIASYLGISLETLSRIRSKI
jgi:CRP-like cAMP-binding protein